MSLKHALVLLSIAIPAISAISACAHAPSSETGKNVVSGSRGPAFVSKKATEAVMTFTHHVRINGDKKPTKAEAEEQVRNQLMHLFGPMERAEYAGVPKEDHEVKIKKIEKTPEGNFDITYDYEGTVVVEKGPRTKIDLMLPINPSTIYQEAMVGDHNPCTDDHYQSEGDFWYFWSPAPAYPGCRLKEGVNYEVFKADIDRIKPQARKTYPEYERLFEDGVLDMHMFFGLDDPSHGHDPSRSEDVNAVNYVNTRKQLAAMGFVIRKWTSEEIAKVVALENGERIFVEEAEKPYGDGRTKIRIRLVFGEIGIDEKSRPFHYFFRDALKRGSVMLYDGHSGLGGHLDLSAIQKMHNFRITMPKDRYQIFFFNSCTSYTYYNLLYFQKKRGRGKVDDPKGTKNLDILANGLSTLFDAMGTGNMTLVKAFNKWAESGKRTSYQEIAAAIDSDNLFTVNGDEDNAK